MLSVISVVGVAATMSAGIISISSDVGTSVSADVIGTSAD